MWILCVIIFFLFVALQKTDAKFKKSWRGLSTRESNKIYTREWRHKMYLFIQISDHPSNATSIAKAFNAAAANNIKHCAATATFREHFDSAEIKRIEVKKRWKTQFVRRNKIRNKEDFRCLANIFINMQWRCWKSNIKISL